MVNYRAVDRKEKIPYAEPFPVETRMEMPELSYEQEIAQTPIPFSHRVEFLSDYVKSHPKTETARSIAKAVGVSPQQAERMAQLVDANAVVRGDGEVVYEAYTREVIEEEVEWQKLYDSLSDYVSAWSLSYHLAKSRPWVEEHLYGLGIYPEVRIGDAGRPVETYPKEALIQLRAYMLHFPPANDWYSAVEAEAATGRTTEWIEATVRQYDLESERRTSALTHRAATHYSQNTLDTLIELASAIKPAGNWMTVTQIAAHINKSCSWVRSRITEYEHLAEIRLDDTSRSQTHYPLTVIDALESQADELPPLAGDWVTADAIAKAIGADPVWVGNRLGEYAHLLQPRLFIGGKGSLREADHYPPEVCEAMRTLYEARPASAGDWMTVSSLSKRLGRSYKWVQQRIGDYSEYAEDRLPEGSGQVAVHYPPMVLEKLQDRSSLGRGA